MATVLMLSILSGLLLAGFAAYADESAPSEYQVKAAFLYNFAKFVKWPESAFAQTNSPIKIGILGEDPFGGNLDLAIKGKTINGHPLSVIELSSPDEMKNFQIIFVCRKPKRNLVATLAHLNNASVLTVSETDDFLKAGGMIKFVMENARVRFEINDSAATRSGLTISSKLLNVARKRESND
ncbi:MAG TPA: YfiR family protein [Verrucomicrobiae bacterium]|nr:YfiR family protein [Verrucomicrobiae bacterium]